MMNYFRYGNGTNWGPMTGNNADFSAMGPYLPSLYLAMHIITWFLFIALLVAVLRWLWRKGGK